MILAITTVLWNLGGVVSHLISTLDYLSLVAIPTLDPSCKNQTESIQWVPVYFASLVFALPASTHYFSLPIRLMPVINMAIN